MLESVYSYYECKICKTRTKHQKDIDTKQEPIYETDWYCTVCHPIDSKKEFFIDISLEED